MLARADVRVTPAQHRAAARADGGLARGAAPGQHLAARGRGPGRVPLRSHRQRAGDLRLPRGRDPVLPARRGRRGAVRGERVRRRHRPVGRHARRAGRRGRRAGRPRTRHLARGELRQGQAVVPRPSAAARPAATPTCGGGAPTASPTCTAARSRGSPTTRNPVGALRHATLADDPHLVRDALRKHGAVLATSGHHAEVGAALERLDAAGLLRDDVAAAAGRRARAHGTGPGRRGGRAARSGRTRAGSTRAGPGAAGAALAQPPPGGPGTARGRTACAGRRAAQRRRDRAGRREHAAARQPGHGRRAAPPRPSRSPGSAVEQAPAKAARTCGPVRSPPAPWPSACSARSPTCSSSSSRRATRPHPPRPGRTPRARRTAWSCPRTAPSCRAGWRLRWTTTARCRTPPGRRPAQAQRAVSPLQPVLDVVRGAIRFDLGEHQPGLDEMRAARGSLGEGVALGLPMAAFLAVVEHDAALRCGLDARARAIYEWVAERVGERGPGRPHLPAGRGRPARRATKHAVAARPAARRRRAAAGALAHGRGVDPGVPARSADRQPAARPRRPAARADPGRAQRRRAAAGHRARGGRGPALARGRQPGRGRRPRQ